MAVPGPGSGAGAGSRRAAFRGWRRTRPFWGGFLLLLAGIDLLLIPLLNSLTPLVPVTMTDVTTDDFLVASDSLQANQLAITAG